MEEEDASVAILLSDISCLMSTSDNRSLNDLDLRSDENRILSQLKSELVNMPFLAVT